MGAQRVTGRSRKSLPGLVSLVGAGPGDPELITVRGLRCLQQAEVVVHDRLLDPWLLQEAPATAERIFAGKASGKAALSQDGIETVMIARARAGKRVVRLKGGDPFVFGRGGEEVEALAAAGIPYEVVPGVSSAIAAPMAAGIPVTHRELSSMLTVVTGHEDPTKGDTAVDWDWVACGRGTLVVLMGLERLESIATRLIAGGRDAAVPAAVIFAGTWPQQRTVVAPLGLLADAARDAGLQSPALIVVGDVVRFVDIVARAGVDVWAEAG
jgi:uroporphyrin-III C-methyltransferase